MSWQSVETNNESWDSKSFTFSPTTAVGQTFEVAASDLIQNNSGADNLEVWVNFEEVTTSLPQNGEVPFYLIFASVDEQVADGSWRSIADSTQQQISSATPLPTERELGITSNVVFDEARPFSTEKGFRFRFSKSPSEELRVRIAAQDANQNGPAGLSSVKVSARYRLY